MANFLARIHERADKLSIWWVVLGPGGVLATVYGVIASFFHPLAQFGWAAIALAAIGLALVSLFVVSIFLIAWRLFRPITRDPENAAPLGDNIGTEPPLPEIIDDIYDRISSLENNVSSIQRRQTEHISTPQLRTELEKQIQDSEVRSTVEVAKAYKKCEQADKEIIEKLEESDRQHYNENNQLSAQLLSMQKSITANSTDVGQLLNFARRNLDIVLIDWIIGWYPENEKTVIQFASDTERKIRSSELQKYIDLAKSELFNSWLNGMIPEILKNSIDDAKADLKKIPTSLRPSDTDQVDLLHYMTVELQAQRLTLYLASQREEVRKGLRGQRVPIETRLTPK